MEATFKEMNELPLAPNISTYNHLIGGNISAWMWGDMESFSSVKFRPCNLILKLTC